MKRLVLVALLLPAAAFAEGEYYGGLGAGASVLEVTLPPLVAGPVTLARDIKGTDVATQQFIGRRFNDYLGVEGGFVRLGTVNQPLPAPIPPFDSRNNSLKSYGYDLYLMGFYPVNAELRAFARAGVIHWDSRLIAAGEISPLKRDGDDLAVGLGADFVSSGPFGMRIEIKYFDISFADTSWMFSISALYRVRDDR